MGAKSGDWKILPGHKQILMAISFCRKKVLRYSTDASAFESSRLNWESG